MAQDSTNIKDLLAADIEKNLQEGKRTESAATEQLYFCKSTI
jgi:hypothetical protein